jgi:hypothetical protein
MTLNLMLGRMERGSVSFCESGIIAMSVSTSQPTFEVKVPAPELTKGEREYQTFRRLLPLLLSSHCGQYVAIHDGQVVDSGTDDIALIQRVHARFGYVPIHVGLVADSLPVDYLPHYR